MIHIEYWLCEKDGEKFPTEYLCEEHEIRLLERDCGITYLDENGNRVYSFDNAFTVCLDKKIDPKDFTKIKEWYGTTEFEIPNEIGVYIWSEELYRWHRDCDKSSDVEEIKEDDDIVFPSDNIIVSLSPISKFDYLNEASVANVIYYNNNYYLKRDCDGEYIATGDGLKKYSGYPITTVYTGAEYGPGYYALVANLGDGGCIEIYRYPNE